MTKVIFSPLAADSISTQVCSPETAQVSSQTPTQPSRAYLDMESCSGADIRLTAVRGLEGDPLPLDVAQGHTVRFKLDPSVCPAALETLATSQAVARLLDRIRSSRIGVDLQTGQTSYRLSAKEPMSKIQALLDALPVAEP